MLPQAREARDVSRAPEAGSAQRGAASLAQPSAGTSSAGTLVSNFQPPGPPPPPVICAALFQLPQGTGIRSLHRHWVLSRGPTSGR